MKKLLAFFIILCFACTTLSAQQTRYIIQLKDKGTNPFSIANPSAYLSPRALQRRARYNIAIDSSDLPVTPRYIDSIRLAGSVIILNSSKWLNQVSIKTTDATALTKINALPFVVSTTPIASFTNQPTNSSVIKRNIENSFEPIPENSNRTENSLADVYNYGSAGGQVRLHQGQFLHNHGFKGEGMRLSVLDAGFYHYQTLPTFDSIRINNQILDISDFVAKDNSVNEDDSHGMKCLSTIAANIPGVFTGTAPKAAFCLYRTEDVASETRIEEHNLAAGYERADSIGVDVCSVSLGYNTFDFTNQNYTYLNDMNGHKTISAVATNIAARKGMLSVIACGNDGNGAWHYVATPGDADSAMTVGAVDTLGIVAGFSSYGPNSSGGIKPNVAATGLRAVVANSSTGLPELGNGTSFATPNMAGLTICLWQAFPEFNNMTILDAMQKASTKATTPDNRVGYGIPDMKKAFCMLLKKSYTQQVSLANCIASFSLNVKFDNSMKVVVEKKQNGETNYTSINTINGIGSFLNKNVFFTDNLSQTTAGTASYRIRIDIATDTSFYLDSMMVNVTKPSFGNDQTITKCNSSIVNLNSLINTTGTNYSWTFNGTVVNNPTQVTANGTYQIIGSNSSSGCADTALVIISQNPTANLNLGADTTITKCVDSSINLAKIFLSTGFTSVWKLNGIVINNISNITSEGVYQLFATNSYGCADTVLLTIKNSSSLCASPQIIITPNPVIDNANIYVFKGYEANVECVLYNQLGQKISSLQNKQAGTPKTYTMPMNKLQSGVYFIAVFVDGKKGLTQKLVKK